MPRQYAPELRHRVIELIKSGKSVSEVAGLVEPSAATVYHWWNQHLVDTGQKVGTATVENSDLIVARRRINDLEKELAATQRANDLLKAVVPPKGSLKPLQ